jgi:hypothetical protein
LDKYAPKSAENHHSLAVENAQQRLLGISGGIVFVPPSLLIGEHAKAPGTAGFGGSFSLAVGSYQK